MTSYESKISRNGATAAVAITGWALHVPGFDLGILLEGCQSEPSCAPEDAHELLGRKGLLNKEPATRLALCATHKALNYPPAASRRKNALDPATAVVASSNLGNVHTVSNIASTLRVSSVRDVSAMDAPNASSNIIASTLAIWFQFGGPNLMVCSGATSGLDAIALGCLLLWARRATRVIVVGAEPEDAVATKLHRTRTKNAGAGQLRAGAACVVLELFDPGRLNALILVPMPGLSTTLPMRFGGFNPSLIVGPNQIDLGTARVIDLIEEVGDTYGAHGVLQVAVAAAALSATPEIERTSVAVVCGDVVDGWRLAVITRGQNVNSVTTAARKPVTTE